MTEWGHIESVFEQAMALDPERRAGFIEAKCPDAGVRAQVESLIRHAGIAGEFLEHPPTVPDALGEPADDPSKLLGQRLGAYTIDAELASGGMGHVYDAHRSDGEFEQRVAIKVIRPGLALPAAIERFRSERRLLAHLDHPRIARLIDAGTTPDGRPYFVMEFVEGVPVTAAANRLTLDGRIDLFLQIADAVAYAHSRLVVHRDLKPGNILVGADGQTKLLDFGIAKLLTPDTSELTAPGERPLTPQYASPEQVRGEAITTATDVYALGLLLYELLTGRRPYQVGGTPPEDSGRIVCETIPAPPSELGGAGRHLLRGDLDRIILKAIAKDPADRYRSAIEFVADVEHWRRHEPVIAGPDSAVYRARKFLRRHRAGVALTSVAAVVLVGGLIAAITGYWHATEARRAETQQRIAAEQVGAFLDDMLGSIDPVDARGRDTTLLREVLDGASRRLSTITTMAPEVRLPLERRMGESYVTIGELEAGRDHLESARAIAHELGWERQPEAGEVAHWLGRLAYAEGHLDDAEREIRLGLEIRRGNPEPDPIKVGQSLSVLGSILLDLSRFDEARETIGEAMTIWRLHRGVGSTDAIGDAAKLAGIALEQGKTEEAIALLESTRELLDEDDETGPAGASIYNMLAVALKRAGELERAESVFEEAMEIMARVFGDDHPNTLTVRANRANVLDKLGRLAEAKTEQLAVLEARGRTLPERHPDRIASLANLALLGSKMGEHEEAIDYARRSTRLSSEVFGEDHPNTAMCRGGLGQVLLRAGGDERLREAEGHLTRAHGSLAAALGDDHPATRQTRDLLRELYAPGALDRPDRLADLGAGDPDASAP